MKISSYYPNQVKRKALPGVRVQGGATADMFGAGQAESIAGAGRALMNVSNKVNNIAEDKKREQERKQKEEQRQAKAAAKEAQKAANRAANIEELEFNADVAIDSLPEDVEQMFGYVPGVQNDATAINTEFDESGELASNSVIPLDRNSKAYIMHNLELDDASIYGELINGSGFTADTTGININDIIGYGGINHQEELDSIVDDLKEKYNPHIQKAKTLRADKRHKALAKIANKMDSALNKVITKQNEEKEKRLDNRLNSAVSHNGDRLFSAISEAKDIDLIQWLSGTGFENESTQNVKNYAIEFSDSCENRAKYEGKYYAEDVDSIANHTKRKALPELKKGVKSFTDSGQFIKATVMVMAAAKSGCLREEDRQQLVNDINAAKTSFDDKAATERGNNLAAQTIDLLSKNGGIIDDPILNGIQKQAKTLKERESIKKAINIFQENKKEYLEEQSVKVDKAFEAIEKQGRYIAFGEKIYDPETNQEIQYPEERRLKHNERMNKILSYVPTAEGKNREEQLNGLSGEKLRKEKLSDHDNEILAPEFRRNWLERQEVEKAKHGKLKDKAMAWYNKENSNLKDAIEQISGWNDINTETQEDLLINGYLYALEDDKHARLSEITSFIKKKLTKHAISEQAISKIYTVNGGGTKTTIKETENKEIELIGDDFANRLAEGNNVQYKFTDDIQEAFHNVFKTKGGTPEEYQWVGNVGTEGGFILFKKNGKLWKAIPHTETEKGLIWDSNKIKFKYEEVKEN